MANYDGSLKAVDCHIRCVRYDMAFNRGANRRLRSHQVTYDVIVTPIRDADTVKMSLSREKDASILSWPTMMGH
eukprot:scaffold37868_cov94-Skeletonema_marinoi.AAC.2